MARLFKDKYVICIYETTSEETCVGQFNNVHELSKFLNKTLNQTQCFARDRFKNRFKKRKNIFALNNEIYEIAFVNMA